MNKKNVKSILGTFYSVVLKIFKGGVEKFVLEVVLPEIKSRDNISDDLYDTIESVILDLLSKL